MYLNMLLDILLMDPSFDFLFDLDTKFCEQKYFVILGNKNYHELMVLLNSKIKHYNTINKFKIRL